MEKDKFHSTEESVCQKEEEVKKLKVSIVTLQMAASDIYVYIRIWQIHLQSYNYPSTMIMLCAWTTSYRVTCNQKETRCKLWKRLHYRKRQSWTIARYVCSYLVCTYAELPLMSGLCVTDV